MTVLNIFYIFGNIIDRRGRLKQNNIHYMISLNPVDTKVSIAGKPYYLLH